MSPLIFAYIVLFTLLLSGATAAFEWGTRGRIAARHMWTVAIAASVIAPVGSLLWSATQQRATSSRISRSANAAPRSLVLVTRNATAGTSSQAGPQTGVVHALLIVRQLLHEKAAVLNTLFVRTILPVWGLLSASLMLWMGIGMYRWRLQRELWRRARIDGIDVDISPGTGPAVLGVISQRIVLPTWATELPSSQLRLILAHEGEHIRARDPQRLAFAIGALFLMPWNVGLWFCAAKLRRAVELDCDARVLQRFPSAKAYGYALLEVAARTRRTGALSVRMVGLTGLPSELETRLRAITRPRSASTRMIAGGALIAMAAIATAFASPVPSLNEGLALSVPRSVVQTVGYEAGAAGSVHGADAQSPTPMQRQRSIDSVNALIRALQERTVNLEKAQSELRTSHEALLAAAKQSPIPDSMHPRVTGAAPQMSGSPFDTVDAAPAVPGSSDTRRALTKKYTRLRGPIERALRERFAATISDPARAAVIWLMVDSTGRVLGTRYIPGYPRPFSPVDSLAAQFPNVNPAAVDFIANDESIAGRSNIMVISVALKGHPSRYFKHSN